MLSKKHQLTGYAGCQTSGNDFLEGKTEEQYLREA